MLSKTWDSFSRILIPGIDHILHFFFRPTGFFDLMPSVLSEQLTYTATLSQCGKYCSGWQATEPPPSLMHDGSLETETERNNVKAINKLKINERKAKRSGLWVGWKCGPNARQAAYCQPFGLVTAVASIFLSASFGWHQAATWSSHHRHDRSYHIQLNHYAEAFITIVTNWTINHPTPPPCSHTPTPLVWLAKTSSTVGDKRLTETWNNGELHRTSSWEKKISVKIALIHSKYSPVDLFWKELS